MKFGGTSVGSSKIIIEVARLVCEEKREKVVVVSAMSGVTDKLEKMAKKVSGLPASVVDEEVEKFHEEMLVHHINAAKEALSDEKIRDETVKQINELAASLKVALLGVGYLEDLAPKSMDYIYSFGERFSILIVSAALRCCGVKAVPLTGYEAGIVTNGCFGQARPLFKRLDKTVNDKLLPRIKAGETPVVTGFVAADEKGRITTLGRGGSDYTASLIGRYMKAEEVQIWTDVDGIFSTDPRIAPEARLIDNISYLEAMDLAYFGAKVIHSKMIEPAMDADIPVRIKNTFNPKHPGTLIVSEKKETKEVVKAIAIAKNVSVVNMKGIGLVETPNVAATVFDLLGDNNINIIMISGASESNMSFVIKKQDLQTAVSLLSGDFLAGCIRDLEVIDNVSIITVVGVGMRGTKGIAAKIFQTVSDAEANIIMIAQGSSEVNISFIVKGDEGERVLKALHKKFVEKK